MADFNGKCPKTSLTAVNGILYGTALSVGENAHGCVFSFNPTTGTLTDLVDFNGTNGDYPYAGLTEVNGVLYGTTEHGGKYDDGTIFALTPNRP